MKKIFKTLLPIASTIAVVSPVVCLTACGNKIIQIDKLERLSTIYTLQSDFFNLRTKTKYSFYLNFDALDTTLNLQNGILAFTTFINQGISTYAVINNKKAQHIDNRVRNNGVTLLSEITTESIDGVLFENVMFAENRDNEKATFTFRSK